MNMTTASYHLGLMVNRSDGGWYDLIGAAEPEDWTAVTAEADEIEDLGAIHGWGDWTRAFRLRDRGGRDLYYFAQ
jgi:hypothetical protein